MQFFLRSSIGIGAILAGGCFHDFDEPFTRGGAAPTGGAAEAGGGGSTGSRGGESSDGGGGNAQQGGAGGTNGGGGAGEGGVLGECGPASTCAPAIPDGWTGPLYYAETASSAPPLGCGQTQAFDGFAGVLTVDPATCNGCSCNWSGGTCGAAGVDFTDNCNVGTIIKSVTNVNGCTGLGFLPSGMSDGTAGVRVKAPSVTNPGSCTPNGGGVSVLPPVSWSMHARACTTPPASATCGSGACIPDPPPKFAAGVCIMASGEVKCPAGHYSEQHVVYTGIDDQRGCSMCDCGGATGTTCSATMNLYDVDNCADPVLTATTGMCADATTVLHSVDLVSKTASGGSCTITDALPTGTAVPAGATTICCSPPE